MPNLLIPYRIPSTVILNPTPIFECVSSLSGEGRSTNIFESVFLCMPMCVCSMPRGVSAYPYKKGSWLAHG